MAGGDANADDAVDLADFLRLNVCFSGSDQPAETLCACAFDFDGDMDVDCLDGEQFDAAWTAAGRPPPLLLCPGDVPTLSTRSVVLLGLALLACGWVVLRRTGGACRC